MAFLHELFNEKSDRWIKIYKGIVIFVFFACLLFGVIAGIGDASYAFLDFDLGGDIAVFDFLVWVIIGATVAFIQLVVNMLLIQFLNNVQICRGHIENIISPAMLQIGKKGDKES